jgi:hypothetical protein
LTKYRDIESRLENWARWATSSEGGTAAACITGAICENMRKASTGVLSGGTVVLSQIDSADAVLIGRAIVRIDFNQRRLLGLHYIDAERSSYIAAMLRFPRHDFEHRMKLAREALEAALFKMSQFSNSQ